MNGPNSDNPMPCLPTTADLARMAVTKEAYYTRFDYLGRENEPWVMWVVDDDWEAWPTAEWDQREILTSTGVSTELHEDYMEHYWRNEQLMNDSYPRQHVLAMLPFYCSELSGVSTVIFSDFLLDKTIEAISPVLADLRTRKRLAFLLDVTVHHQGGSFAFLNRTLEYLDQQGVSPFHRTFLTLGAGLTRAGIRKILKDTLLRTNGAALQEWWTDMQDGTDYTPFYRKTSRGDTQLWHHASDLPKFRRHPRFGAFLDELAENDKFGVWPWAQSLIKSKASDPLAAYAYSCAKWFMNYADRDKHGEDRTVPFMALRGLIYGICNQLRQGQIPVHEKPDELPKMESQTEDGIDGSGCFGYAALEEPCFTDFAIHFRDWLSALHANRCGSARLQEVVIERRDGICTLTLHFSSLVEPGAFADLPTGVVSYEWSLLKQWKSIVVDASTLARHGSDMVTFRFALGSRNAGRRQAAGK